MAYTYDNNSVGTATRIKISVPLGDAERPGLDVLYGPYDNITDAIAALTDSCGSNFPPGYTIAIKDTTKGLVEYWNPKKKASNTWAVSDFVVKQSAPTSTTQPDTTALWNLETRLYHSDKYQSTSYETAIINAYSGLKLGAVDANLMKYVSSPADNLGDGNASAEFYYCSDTPSVTPKQVVKLVEKDADGNAILVKNYSTTTPVHMLVYYRNVVSYVPLGTKISYKQGGTDVGRIQPFYVPLFIGYDTDFAKKISSNTPAALPLASVAGNYETLSAKDYFFVNSAASSPNQSVVLPTTVPIGKKFSIFGPSTTRIGIHEVLPGELKLVYNNTTGTDKTANPAGVANINSILTINVYAKAVPYGAAAPAPNTYGPVQLVASTNKTGTIALNWDFNSSSPGSSSTASNAIKTTDGLSVWGWKDGFLGSQVYYVIKAEAGTDASLSAKYSRTFSVENLTATTIKVTNSANGQSAIIGPVKGSDLFHNPGAFEAGVIKSNTGIVKVNIAPIINKVNVTFSVAYSNNTYAKNASNGNIKLTAPSAQSIDSGGSCQFSAPAFDSSQYVLESVKAGATTLTATNNKYSLTNVTANTAVTFNFKAKTYTVTVKTDSSNKYPYSTLSVKVNNLSGSSIQLPYNAYGHSIAVTGDTTNNSIGYSTNVVSNRLPVTADTTITVTQKAAPRLFFGAGNVGDTFTITKDVSGEVIGTDKSKYTICRSIKAANNAILAYGGTEAYMTNNKRKAYMFIALPSSYTITRIYYTFQGQEIPVTEDMLSMPDDQGNDKAVVPILRTALGTSYNIYNLYKGVRAADNDYYIQIQTK